MSPQTLSCFTPLCALCSSASLAPTGSIAPEPALAFTSSLPTKDFLAVLFKREAHLPPLPITFSIPVPSYLLPFCFRSGTLVSFLVPDTHSLEEERFDQAHGFVGLSSCPAGSKAEASWWKNVGEQTSEVLATRNQQGNSARGE